MHVPKEKKNNLMTILAKRPKFREFANLKSCTAAGFRSGRRYSRQQAKDCNNLTVLLLMEVILLGDCPIFFCTNASSRQLEIFHTAIYGTWRKNISKVAFFSRVIS